jgi:aminopeptidase-like protein
LAKRTPQSTHKTQWRKKSIKLFCVTVRQAIKLTLHSRLANHSFAARWVYVYLLEYGQGSYSLRKLAAELGLSFVTIKAALDALYADGLLEEIQPAIGPKSAIIKARQFE